MSRLEYLRDIEALHAEPPAKFPGSPPLETVVLLETLGPKRMKFTTQLTLSEQGGEVEAEFHGSRTALVEPHAAERCDRGD